jgi:hypothetical protein
VINPRGRAEAQQGCHDDCVLALALMVVVMARMSRPLPPAGTTPAPAVMRYGRSVESEGRGQRVRLR